MYLMSLKYIDTHEISFASMDFDTVHVTDWNKRSLRWHVYSTLCGPLSLGGHVESRGE